MSESILTSVKKVLGLAEDYTAFDIDVVMHINTALGILQQLGVGPTNGLIVEDTDMTWDELFDWSQYGDEAPSVFSMVRTYVYLRVRLLFDPPQVGFLLEAMENQIEMLEWRISSYREANLWTAPVAEEV